MSSRSQKALSSTSIKAGNAKNLASSNVSSSTSLKINVDNEDIAEKTPSKPNPVLSYYYSKQLIK